MARSGVVDFMRKERLKRLVKAAKAKHFVTRATDTVALHNKRKPYTMLPAEASFLGTHARKDCYKCKGLGVSRWRNKGLMIEICKCVQAKLDEIKPDMAEQQQWVIDQINNYTPAP